MPNFARRVGLFTVRDKGNPVSCFLPMSLLLPHRVLAWLLLTGGLLIACETDDRPDKLIDTDKMVSVLTDVHLAETRVSRLGIASTDSANLVYKRLESQILRKHGVDTLVYEKSYVYYSSHPREMEVIYKQVVANLETELDSTRNKPVKQ